MQKITGKLWLTDQAELATRLYTSLFVVQVMLQTKKLDSVALEQASPIE
jgi:predicted 3-demethylubiquinone-9 3-methyltransferase (glyoxalase superfamily)